MKRPDGRRSALTGALGVALVAALVAGGCGTPPPTRSADPGSLNPTASATAATSPAPTQAATPTPAPTIAPSPSPSPSPSPAIVLDAAKGRQLQAAIAALRSKGGIPGMSVALVFPDGTLWTGQSGLAVRATRESVSPATVFSVGSMTKTFVAALILRLAERGTLSLDDPLRRFVPEFTAGASVTVRQLLDHTSGIQDLFEAPGVSAAILGRPAVAWTPQQVLARIGRPYFSPGHGYRYSNNDYVLLGLVAERATGEKLAALLRAEFLGPLGLTDTYVQAQEAPATPLALAHGYTGTAKAPHDVTGASGIIPFLSEATAAGASGAMASTARDMARWATALYGGRVLTAASLDAMTDVSATRPFKAAPPYGLGFEQFTVAGATAWGHRGHLDGFWGSMLYLPAWRLTVVVLTNAQWADPIAISGTLAATALSSEPAQVPPAPPTPAAP